MICMKHFYRLSVSEFARHANTQRLFLRFKCSKCGDVIIIHRTTYIDIVTAADLVQLALRHRRPLPPIVE